MHILVQFRVTENHGELYELVKRLSEANEKGYMADQLRSRLLAFQTLVGIVGEDNPFEVVSKLSAAWHLTHSAIEKGSMGDDEKQVEQSFDDDILALADADFGM